MFSSTKLRLVALLLIFAIPSGCGDDNACERTRTCQSSSSGGSDVAEAGAGSGPESGGKSGAGGVRASSGGRSGVGGHLGDDNSGGEAGAPGAGGSDEVTAPRVVEVLVGGRAIGSGEELQGVDEAPEILFRFSEAMDKLATEAAYSSRDAAIKNSNVTFRWNRAATEVTVTPNVELTYDETTDPNLLAKVYHFTLTTVALSADQVELASEFSAGFSLLRRITQRIAPDGKNSLFSADPDSTDLQGLAAATLPYLAAPWFYCGDGVDPLTSEQVLDLLGYVTPEEKGYHVLVGRTANLGERNMGVMSFPLDRVPRGRVEAARLALVKWRDQPGADLWAVSEMEQFSVDALSSQGLTLSTLSSPSLRSNLRNTSGESFSLGYGQFEFDVTSLVQDAKERGDLWAMYRLEFDKARDWGPEYTDSRSMCASLALTVTYLAE